MNNIVLSRNELISFQEKESIHGLNRQLNIDALREDFKPEEMFYIRPFMIHNDDHWRLQIFVKTKKFIAFMDSSFSGYENLSNKKEED